MVGKGFQRSMSQILAMFYFVLLVPLPKKTFVDIHNFVNLDTTHCDPSGKILECMLQGGMIQCNILESGTIREKEVGGCKVWRNLYIPSLQEFIQVLWAINNLQETQYFSSRTDQELSSMKGNTLAKDKQLRPSLSLTKINT